LGAGGGEALGVVEVEVNAIDDAELEGAGRDNTGGEGVDEGGAVRVVEGV